MNFYTLYRCHNYHFKLYGAMFLGQHGAALDAADELDATLAGGAAAHDESPPMADWLEGFVPMRLHVLIRFGHWQRDHRAPLPADPELYCVTTAMMHYAKGVALRRHSATSPRPRRERDCSGPRRRACPTSRYLSTTPAWTSWPSPRRCWRARSPTARASSTTPSPTCARSVELDDACPTTSRGAGCSRRAMRSARCCSSRAASRRPRRSTAPTSASTAAARAPASIRRMSGACTATTNACARLGKPPRPRSSASASTSPRRAPTCRSALLLLPRGGDACRLLTSRDT